MFTLVAEISTLLGCTTLTPTIAHIPENTRHPSVQQPPHTAFILARVCTLIPSNLTLFETNRTSDHPPQSPFFRAAPLSVRRPLFTSAIRSPVARSKRPPEFLKQIPPPPSLAHSLSLSLSILSCYTTQNPPLRHHHHHHPPILRFVQRGNFPYL